MGSLLKRLKYATDVHTFLDIIRYIRFCTQCVSGTNHFQESVKQFVCLHELFQVELFKIPFLGHFHLPDGD